MKKDTKELFKPTVQTRRQKREAKEREMSIETETFVVQNNKQIPFNTVREMLEESQSSEDLLSNDLND